MVASLAILGTHWQRRALGCQACCRPPPLWLGPGAHQEAPPTLKPRHFLTVSQATTQTLDSSDNYGCLWRTTTKRTLIFRPKGNQINNRAQVSIWHNALDPNSAFVLCKAILK